MRIALAILFAIASAAFSIAVEPPTITLRTTVVLEHDATPTLADVAILSGQEANRLAHVPIDLKSLRADPAGWMRLDAQDLRQLADANADRATNWGAVQLRGGPCYIRILAPAATTTPAAEQQPSTTQTPTIPGTVRQLAEAWIARAFKVSPQDVEVRWVSAAEGLLDHPTAGLLPHITDAGRSNRMALRITLYDAQAAVAVEGEARAEIRIRRDVAVLTRDVTRRRVLTSEDVRFERQWLDATATPADPTSVIGREVAMPLRAGAVISAADVHTSPVVKRGDRVQVRIITPTVTATLLARALADGRPGETIPFESIAPSRSDRLRFDARVENAGAAVAIARSTSP
ncbi:MAG: flagellar basal body P-ring formation protein FlgA [Phycisphaeraceae bacterium]|nr:flagellar basal body P-ring formation protein FlgA [Phycisphaeraceae bacterium]